MLKIAMLLIGHGSRSSQANAGVYELAERVAERLPNEIIEVAFMEVSKPSIQDVCKKLVDSGVTHIVALPVMLMAAGHVKNDLPCIVQNIENSLSVSIQFIPGLSITENVIAAAQHRVQHQVQQRIQDRVVDDSALLVVGSGSSMEGGGTNLHMLAEALADRLNFSKGIACFTGIAKPDLPGAIDTVKGRYKTLVVFPCFLFSGFLSEKVSAYCESISSSDEALQLIVASPFNSHPKIIDECVFLLNTAKEEMPL